jgi:hypothetical protein
MAVPETKPEVLLQHGADACEHVAAAIASVAQAATRIVNGPLELRSAALLIRAMLPRGSKLDVPEIVAVLQAAAGVARFHLKTPPPEARRG